MTTVDERNWVILVLTERGVSAAADVVKQSIRVKLHDGEAEITVPPGLHCAFVRYEHAPDDYRRMLTGTQYVLEPQRLPGTSALATVSTSELDAVRAPVVEQDTIGRGDTVTITGGLYRGLQAVARRVEQTAATVGIQLLTLKRVVKIPRGWLKRGDAQ